MCVGTITWNYQQKIAYTLKLCLLSLEACLTSRPNALFTAHKWSMCFCFGYCLTWVVEKIRPFKNVPFMDVWLNSIITIQVLFTLIHLTTLYHLQPLRVMPAKLLTLNFLCPFFIIFLLHIHSKCYYISLLVYCSEIFFHEEKNLEGLQWGHGNIKNTCSELYFSHKEQLRI